MKENQINHYFNEWWNRAMSDFAFAKSKTIVEDFSPETQKIWVYKSGYHSKTEPAPLFMMEWAESNPLPGVSRDEFIVALAKRVEALEAALAKKGGAK